MDRMTPQRPFGQRFDHASQTSLPTTYPQPFPPPTSQPPIQLPLTDPFSTSRDPFLPGPHGRRGSIGLQSRAWPPAQAQPLPNGHPESTPPQQQSQPLPPPPPTNGLAPMSLPYDPSRRRSLGVPASPPQYAQAPREPLSSRPPFQSRQMPPPSPPQIHSSASSLQGPAPRGPPTASPFAGARDLASFASHRPSGGMSISSILGGNEETKPHSSPHAHATATSTPKSMPPPSPGRARASSMREGAARGYRDVSPPRHMFEERRPASAVFGQERQAAETRKEGLFHSPQLSRESTHSFRAFHPPHQEAQSVLNGQGRPNSQPAEPAAPRSIDEINRREAPVGGRFGTFRTFEPHALPRSEAPPHRHETRPFQNDHGYTSHPVDRGVFGSPHIDRDPRQPGLQRFQPGALGTPIRDEQAGLFRPIHQPSVESARVSVESRQLQELRREAPRSSPPLSDMPIFDRDRNGFIDRPITFEEHQRMEAMHREQQQRKESDGSAHRSLLNVSPELSRRGRNSPLPQAVQGAQPRHVGPGGNNPGIKMEFGRMFSGLGSGVGSATPTAGQSVNGTTTPPRLSPIRHVEGGDLVRTAVAEIEDGASGVQSSKRTKKSSRRARDEEQMNGHDRETPDGQRGSKRSKTSHPIHHHHHHVHPNHHHHHHHHEGVDNGPSPFNMLRFPSNPLSHSSLIANPTHHHHHHHTAASGSHAHPGHHHHHAPRSVPAPRKPATTVMSRRLVEECAKKPRKHLGSQLYTTEVSMPPAADAPLGSKIKLSSTMKPIPVFDGKENCTYTVRVPREYLAASQLQASGGGRYLEEICKRRQLWGTDIYTDDSDVVAAAVHAGWLRGDFGEFNDDLREVCDNDSEQADDDETPTATSLAIRPRKPVIPPPDHDAHITILILPALESYASTNQHHIWSRGWANTHDGMSFMIHQIDFIIDGNASRNAERGAAARKQRLAAEQKKRQEAADGLLMFANRPIDEGGSVRVGA